MGNSNIMYEKMDLGIKSQIIDEFKKMYFDEIEKTHLHFDVIRGDDCKKAWVIIVNDRKIIFNSFQSFIEFAKELNRPFIIDKEWNKLQFIYGLPTK